MKNISKDTYLQSDRTEDLRERNEVIDLDNREIHFALEKKLRTEWWAMSGKRV